MEPVKELYGKSNSTKYEATAIVSAGEVICERLSRLCNAVEALTATIEHIGNKISYSIDAIPE